MKKLLTLILVLLLTFSLSLVVFAAEVEVESSEVVTEGETADQIIEETSTKLSTILTTCGIGGIAVIVITIIGFVAKNFKKITSFLSRIVSIFSDGKSITNMPEEINGIKADFRKISKELEEELAKNEQLAIEVKELIEKQDHLLSVFIINSNLVNPYAKAEMMKIMCGQEEIGESVEETLKNVETKVEVARSTDIKPETPHLDKVISKAENEV